MNADQWMDEWLETLSFKQKLLAFSGAVLLMGFLVSLIVLLARFSVWQAALAGLATISAIFLYFIVHVAFLVVRKIYASSD